MKSTTNNSKFDRKRKFLLFLPLLLWPFLLLLFWSLGGGKKDDKNRKMADSAKGFNMNLPGAHLKEDKKQNKLSYYEVADQDSEKLKEKIKNDPYFKGPIGFDSIAAAAALGSFDRQKGGWGDGRQTPPGAMRGNERQDSNEVKVYKKLQELTKIISSPLPPPDNSPSDNSDFRDQSRAIRRDQADRVEKLMQSARQSDAAENAKLARYDGMLDKIFQIQHPEQVLKNAVASAAYKKPYDLNQKTALPTVGDFADSLPPNESAQVLSSAVFFSIDDNAIPDTTVTNLITAVVPYAQTVVRGSTLTLRLTQDALIGGITIPKDNLLSGFVSWQNDRIIVNISSIRYKNTEYPVSLKVFDMDGLEGLNIPGSINREVSKESLDQGISSVGITSLDPSLGAQAASAGIQAAKTLFSRKIKLVRGVIREGYQVYLQNAKIVSH